MGKTIWDRFAPVYSLAMKSQKNIYDYMYNHIADAVIIANALHVVPNPEKVLSEIDRVLVNGGLLICPTFIHRSAGKKENLWAKILKLVGIKFAHQWTADEFTNFMENNGWKITAGEVVPGRIDLFYAECVRK